MVSWMRESFLSLVVLTFLCLQVSAVPISNCTQIDSPGYYYLTRDLAGVEGWSCIKISASDVVFDGNGFSIVGDGSGDGISVFNFSISNVTIKNVTVKNYWTGIDLSNCRNCTIANVAASENYYGISLSSSSRNKISDVTVSGNRHGIHLSSTSNSMIANVTASENYFNGISLYYSKNNTISNVTLANNWHGVSLDSSDKNTITKGYFRNNEVGIYLWDSNNNLIYDNYFNNTKNASISAGSNIWNASKTPGKNIVGGNYLGGNYWGSPNGKGFSDTCSDSNYDGFCDQPFAIDDKNIDYFPKCKLCQKST